MNAIITDTIQGKITSVSECDRAFSVRVSYLISIKPFTVAPRSNHDSLIEHTANVTVVVKVLDIPQWKEIRFTDTEEFLSRREAEIRENPTIGGSAADYVDEEDAKSAVAQVWSRYDKPDQRKRAIELLLKEGGAQ
jgi:hypothetical protein